MFIVSKRNFLIQLPAGEPYLIRKDFAGEIPDEIARHWMVQEAIRSGAIAAPAGRKDAQLEAAETAANEVAAAVDIRPDAAAIPAAVAAEAGERAGSGRKAGARK